MHEEKRKVADVYMALGLNSLATGVVRKPLYEAAGGLALSCESGCYLLNLQYFSSAEESLTEVLDS